MKPKPLIVSSAVVIAFVSARCASSPQVTTPPGFDAGAGVLDASVESGGDPNIMFDASFEGGRADAHDTGADTAESMGCGDGKLDPGEVCDDKNSQSGDGCSATCDAVEKDYACPTPAMPCVSTVRCGDGKVTGEETCDDSNARDKDGCSAACKLETGWKCPAPGKACEAARCGDGILAGAEECDDRNAKAADGCSVACKLEVGWACGKPGEACHTTVCGDGKKEGYEPCDDGNNVVGDGCNPFCEVEPDCSAGPCHSRCGDGLILPGDKEDCDDGNSKDGDGCSSACKVENGYKCTATAGKLPSVLEVPITYRDFIALPAGGASRHPDFEVYQGQGPTRGLVGDTLGSDGKPVYTGICQSPAPTNPPCLYDAQTTSKAAFDQWYRDTPNVNTTKVTRLSLALQPDNSYYFPDATFFPWDGAGWVAAGKEVPWDGHNFGFTSEMRYWFEFKGGEKLKFSGDDDVWVFVNRKLAVDIGGLHSIVEDEVTLNPANAQKYGLEQGKIYEIALFHAERHTNASNFNLTLNGFVGKRSECMPSCGDGIVSGNETCDDGKNDGSYGSCLSDCTRGPYCGDSTVQTPQEVCDDGTNLTTYTSKPPAGCAPGCKLGATCGDKTVDSLFGEQCDDGTNAGGYGKCGAGCRLGPRCGDRIVQSPQETCDDGNAVSGDGCSETCHTEGPR